ncbi:aspartyl-phosphate phosphatase Spo0E family protein [Paenibacillus septentrionalis]|uniref:Aspartyl-phosphate phosphatase Spo0E family protein n=1 Tax=Paenibacillus septentrionalis TaxID=429342 RepID=A0ABW1V531_9BACL
MNEIERELEAERKKLNELGLRLLQQSIPLADDKELLEISQKVDQLVVRCQRLKLAQQLQEG